jgi:hypothetical protein
MSKSYEKINKNSDRQFMKKMGRKVYDLDDPENKDPRGKTKPFKYKPDRETVRAAKRMLIKERIEGYGKE